MGYRLDYMNYVSGKYEYLLWIYLRKLCKLSVKKEKIIWTVLSKNCLTEFDQIIEK